MDVPLCLIVNKLLNIKEKGEAAYWLFCTPFSCADNSWMGYQRFFGETLINAAFPQHMAVLPFSIVKAMENAEKGKSAISYTLFML